MDQYENFQLHTPQSCKDCAHRQNYDDNDRCARYHDALCEKTYDFCQGDYFLDKKDGISLFAMKLWLERLSREELELPLLFEIYHQKLLPMAVIRSYDVENKDHWCFYAKNKNEELQC